MTVPPSLLVLLMCAATPAVAFLVQSTQSGRGPVVMASWAHHEVPYWIDNAGSADIGAAQTINILRQSLEVWQDVEGSRLRFREEGLSTDRSAARRDRRNLLIFDETGETLDAPVGSGVIAVTRINSDSETGEILDADIIFNGRDFRFSAVPTSGRILLHDVAIHEVGHLIGLDHTPLGGNPARRPTMNPFYFGDGPGEASSLAADDVTGIRVLYPTPSFASASGTITGRVADPDGVDIFGAHVTARNLATGDIHSTLSGAEAGVRDRGAYALRGLPAGDYELQIAPVGGGLDESNFSDLFEVFDTDFPAEYFGNTEVAANALAVHVTAGSPSAGFDFTTGFIVDGVPFVQFADVPGNTPDAQGPYNAFFDITNARRIEVFVDVDGETFSLTGENLGLGMFRAQIPGQPVGSHLRYRITAESEEGNTVNYPDNDGWLEFDVIRLTGEPLAFAVLRTAGVLNVFDTGARREVARVDVGEDPIQILPSHDGRFLYVSDLGSSEITVIDAATFRVAERILVASEPLDMALSPDGATLYVSNSGASGLTSIDVSTRQVLGFVSVGAQDTGPHGIATSGDRVYVTDLHANRVLAVAGGRVVARIPVDGGPRSLATDATGQRLYVTSFNNGNLTIINTATDAVEVVIALPISGAFAIAISPEDDRAYITGHADGVVVVVDLASGDVIESITVGTDPRGLSFSPAGDRLFVTTSSSGEIYVFDARSHEALGIFPAAGGPRGISVVEAPVPVEAATAVEAIDTTPQAWGLSEVYPNPFNPETNLSLTLPVHADVAMEVYNIAGQRIRRIDLSGRSRGRHNLSWNGLDDLGHAASSGTYVFVVRQNGTGSPVMATRKGLLLR